MLAPAHNHDFFRRMAHESIRVDGAEMRALRSAARQNGVVVSIGFSEKVGSSAGTLYNSNVVIGDDGEVLVHHRKLMPTFFEKLTWAAGDGHGLRVADTKHGKIGVLICGENTNPLARYAMMAQGEQVHIATWPAVWPTKLAATTEEEGHAQEDGAVNGGSSSSTNGEKAEEPSQRTKKASSSSRPYDNVAANRTRAAAHCFEAKCFGISCAAYLSPSNIESIASASTQPDFVRKVLESSQNAASMFLDPSGSLVPGFMIDATTGRQVAKDFLQNEEGVLYADMDLEECIEGKQYHDVAGGYQRLDVFEFKVDRSRREPAVFSD